MIRLALTYGAIGLSSAAGYLGLGQGQATAAACALVVAAIIAGVRLRLAGSLPRLPRPSRSTGRRVAVFVLTFSVVSGMVLGGMGPGGGAVGTASAYELGNPGECEALDYLVYVSTAGFVTSNDCTLRYDDSDVTTDIDHYQQGKSWQSQSDAFLTSYENYGQDTSSIAWSKAKIDIVNALNNGNSSAETKAIANETIDDYYSQQQLEILRQYERMAISAEYTYKATNGTVTFNNNQLTGFGEQKMKLANGTEVWVRVPVDDTGSGDAPIAGVSVVSGTRNTTTSMDDDSSYNGVERDSNNLEWVDPSGSDNARPIDNNRMYNLGSEISTQRQQVRANVDQYVDGVYSEYQAGELNATDIADPETLASQAATDYNSSGYYSYAAINLASLGYSGNLNSSMHVTTANNSYNGTIFYTADDVTSFDVGKSYDPANLTGTPFMAVQDGKNGTIIELSETFTVESATNPKTGESMENVTVEKYTYNSTNTSALKSELDQLSSLRQAYEDAKSGGSGGFDIGGKTGAIGALLVVVALLALTRD